MTSVRYHDGNFFLLEETRQGSDRFVLTSVEKTKAYPSIQNNPAALTRMAQRLITPRLLKTKFGDFLTSRIGPPDPDIDDPHAHHVGKKRGYGDEQKALVEEFHDIMWRNKLDPILGLENLQRAPWRVEGQHTTATLREVVESLRAAEAKGGSPARGRRNMVEELKKLGDVARNRRTKL